MNSTVLTLNQWGGRFTDFAWPMLWQSSLLIVVLFAADLLFRRKIRASIRYALWLVVLVKLCLPPTLALPTSPAWWLQKTPPPAAALMHYTVTYDAQPVSGISQNPTPAYVPPKPVMTADAWGLIAFGIVGGLLLVWLSARWWQVARRVRRSKYSEKLTAILNETRSRAGVKSAVPVKLTDNLMSPAVCGLFRPVILIPRSLAENFSDEQLRVVLLHELVHLRRRDVWLNFLQTLLQIVYWWHPLVWLANARIRRVREEAVDDAVMLTLRDEAEFYAPTLLEVAKLAFRRPLMSLGLVGIMESRSALRQRIERLVDFHAPRKAGLTFASLLGICVFGAVALPMGQAPASAPDEFSTAAASAEKTLTLKVNPKVFIRNIRAMANKTMDAPTDN
jgi:beta-lactamase regulating signal transducer with metallopeptidase domain